jgi:hypothetical protein
MVLGLPVMLDRKILTKLITPRIIDLRNEKGDLRSEGLLRVLDSVPSALMNAIVK